MEEFTGLVLRLREWPRKESERGKGGHLAISDELLFEFLLFGVLRDRGAVVVGWHDVVLGTVLHQGLHKMGVR